MPSILVLCYDTSSGKYLAQLAGSAQISDGAITSGLLGSGIVGTVHLRDLAVTSAKLAAAIIGLLGTVADEAITSAKLASGAVGADKVWIRGIWSGYIASGAVIGDVIANRGATSGKIASGATIGDVIANIGVWSGKLASGGVIADVVADRGVFSGKIASGAIAGDAIASWGVISGAIASGIITEQNLVSGISIDISELAQEPSYRAAVLISGFLGVQFVSGYFNYVQAGAPTVMPAVGLSIANIVSGAIGTFQYAGRLTNPNWDFSGYVGSLVFLGTSSEVTLTAPSASGQCAQRVGKVVGPTSIFVRPELAFVQLAQ